jgi:DNA (cytosine-5)-methyltransferase 1
VVGARADTPLPTTTARATQNQLAVANLVHFNHGDKQWSGLDEPLRTVTTGNHAALVYGFLTKYSAPARGRTWPDKPLHTVTVEDRFGLVLVRVAGEPYRDRGHRHADADGRASWPGCQGFPDGYARASRTSCSCGTG